MSFGQNLVFSNANLKSYLLTENSVDLDGDEIGDTIIDTNKDNEIQLSEALAVYNLVISTSNWTITSIQDISQFNSLKRLTINGGLLEISNLGLDSLEFIRVNDINDMTNVDLSDMPNLKSIILESLYRLKNLNLQNGTYASDYFSLFYTDIEYACVDSMAAEYNYVAQFMKNDGIPKINCSLGINSTITEQTFIYPNPIIDEIFIKTNLNDFEVNIYDFNGKIVFSQSNVYRISMYNFNAGMYFLSINEKNKQIHSKIIMKE